MPAKLASAAVTIEIKSETRRAVANQPSPDDHKAFNTQIQNTGPLLNQCTQTGENQRGRGDQIACKIDVLIRNPSGYPSKSNTIIHKQ